MPFALLHTGQTGVERGAYRAARAARLRITGTCSHECRDEFESLAREVVADLTPCTQRGTRSALRATLESANALVIGVPQMERASWITGVNALRRHARALGVPSWVVDGASDATALALALREARDGGGDLRVLVTGPRQTRWPGGESFGFRLVSELVAAAVWSVQRRHRVLVVDDHTGTADTMCMLLRALGHDGRAATTGLQGLELAAALEPDICLVDISLPDISGYELAARLRERQAPMFLAAITGWDLARDPTHAIAAGFDRHVIKPVGPELIRTLLEQADSRLAL